MFQSCVSKSRGQNIAEGDDEDEEEEEEQQEVEEEDNAEDGEVDTLKEYITEDKMNGQRRKMRSENVDTPHRVSKRKQVCSYMLMFYVYVNIAL